MKALFATVAAIGLIATPVIAAPTAKTTKTMTTKTGGAKATTTVTTKVMPGVKQAQAKTRKARSNAMAAKTAKRPAQSAKKTG